MQPTPAVTLPAAGPTRRHLLRGAALAAAGASAWPLRAAPSVLTLAVVPQFTAAELDRDWSPLVAHLGLQLGITIQLQFATNIPRFEAEVLAGTPDLLYGNPYHAVMAASAQGYVPLVRDSSALSGILVVRRDSPVQTVQALDGQLLAFPSPNALGASLYMRALLAEREKINITPVYVQTHSNVYRQVLRGKAAAGGGVNKTLQQEDAAVQAGLRVLMTTPGVAPHPVSAHPRVPAELQQALRQAWLAMAAEATGQALLREVAMPRPVAADYQRDYQPLAQYRLEKYVVAAPAG